MKKYIKIQRSVQPVRMDVMQVLTNTVLIITKVPISVPLVVSNIGMEQIFNITIWITSKEWLQLINVPKFVDRQKTAWLLFSILTMLTAGSRWNFLFLSRSHFLNLAFFSTWYKLWWVVYAVICWNRSIFNISQ